MKNLVPSLVILSAIKLVIHLIGNRNYGFHRDELLHLSVGKHPDWGYMEFPPMIGWIGKLSDVFFNCSLMGTRLFPTLAGVAILVLTGLMAKELGGKQKSVFLASVCILAFLPFYRNHTLFQPVAFDQLFWALGFYFLIKFLNQENKNHLLIVGVILGLGLLTKYTMIMWAFGVFIGMFFFQKAKVYKSKWIYIAGLISFLILLPNLIWQGSYNFPFLLHLEVLGRDQLDEIDRLEFGLEQLNYPLTLIISIIGVIAVFFNTNLKKYIPISIAALVTFFTMWFLNSKSYYIFAIYPVLFALGAVQIESFLSKKPVLIYAVAALLLVPIISSIPLAAPLLKIDQFTSYYNISAEEGYYELTSDYADMFGWEEQVQIVDSLYRSLSLEERNNCVLWAENYGEAGALMVLGEKYNLPKPISRHGSFWLWGYGNKDALVWISLGNETPSVEYVFEETTLVRTISHPYCVEEERNIPLYICRKPKLNIPEWWQGYERHIFD